MHDAISPDPAVLERNLRALATTSPATAQLVATAMPAPIEFCSADDAVTGALHGRWLASRRRPLDEAERFADGIDPKSCGGVVVLGFGVGHHVRAASERLGSAGIVICFEPDPGLLRAVLERVDHSAWLATGTTAILTDPDDSTAINQVTRGVEGLLSVGLRVLTHQPSAGRLGEDARTFAERVATVVRALRTNVMTTLLQSEVTLRNLLMNADFYSEGQGLGDLAGAAHGRPALVVSAGPSLAPALDELADTDVRERAVIIAVQTALKPMLQRGIKPHYVTAIDYHEISSRFYEGLTPADVEGVTLVADPKANPIILESFPGPVRTAFDPMMSRFLGELDRHDRAEIESGATVAHLAYNLARHLGCDPVILVGQDLAFTGGQYYGPGAAIHEVWANELNEFNTLESLEWQRVARMRPYLRPVPSHDGGSVYADEQMVTYLVQFEQMFTRDAARGLTTIDTAVRGAAKRGTSAEPIEHALERVPPGVSLSLPPARPQRSAAMRARIAERADELAQDARRLGELSDKTVRVLEKMRDRADDPRQVDELVPEVHRIAERARAIEPAYTLTQFLNQAGALKRYRADRSIQIEDDETTRQQRQIARDADNVRWIADSARSLECLFEEAADAMRNGHKSTRTPEPDAERTTGEKAGATRRIAAFVAVDPERSGLGAARTLDEPVAGGLNVLQLTLARLASASTISRIVLLTAHPELVAGLVGQPPSGATVDIRQTDGHPLGDRRALVGPARAFARDCWRGGLANATVWDEVYSAAPLAEAMLEHGADAAVILGADWCAIDPDLIDAVVTRYLEAPSRQPFVFSPTAPGLAPALLARELVAELARREHDAPLLASLSGLTGYLPASPVVDPIAKSFCVHPPLELRDAGARWIADSSTRLDRIRRAFHRSGSGSPRTPTPALLGDSGVNAPFPEFVELELCTGRLTSGRRAMVHWRGEEPPARGPIDGSLARKVLDEIGRSSPDSCITFGGVGDPMGHPDWVGLLAHARRAGIGAIHLRTDLVADHDTDTLLACGADVISVDLLAETPETYRALTGMDYFGRARAALESLVSRRDSMGVPVWIVPRIARMEPALGEIETFYDRWLLGAGAAIIDPPPGDDGTCRALPIPARAGDRTAATTAHVLADGLVVGARAGWRKPRPLADLRDSTIADAWRRARAGRGAGARWVEAVA